MFHDLRRTVARNLVRSGVSETVAMARTGHKTPSMFRLYSIVSAEDQMEADRKLTAYLDAQPTASYVVIEKNARTFRKFSAAASGA